ncbi:MAG: DUF4157 domain-containing protein [ANME-2 cluster archaeon]|nr:DUF4157 domain-containing protein [ANME-2 cluster archaeon]
MINSGFLQAKLRIGRPDDAYEQEADRVADTVMRMKVPTPVSHNTLPIQRACPSCEEEEMQRQPIGEEEELQMQPGEVKEEVQMRSKTGGLSRNPMMHLESLPPPEEEEMLQAKSRGEGAKDVSSNVLSHISKLQGGGQQLPESARTYFEPRFGYDLSNVRVHDNGQASHAARSIHARAFTMGNNVVFGSGEYSPGTSRGKKLLAHELTHVIQQSRSGSLKRQQYASGSNPDIQNVRNGRPLFLQRWSIGAPVSGINTIVCNGSGGIDVQAGATGNAQQTKCLKQCIVQHEKSHRADALAENAKICNSQASGKTVRPDNGTQRKKTEIKASNVEITCLNNTLPKASGTCKPIIKARITQMKAYRDSFK